MQFFPSREIFLQIGNIAIRWYAVLILTGALIALFGSRALGKKAGYDDDIFDDIFMCALGGGIVGARLWYCIFYDFEGYFSNPISLIEIWDGGLAIQGGLFVGFALTCIYCKTKKISVLRLADIVAPFVLVAQALGRWGNFANQEAFGNIVSEDYYNGILFFLKDGMYISGQYRQPMFFYESVLCILGFILIRFYLKKSFKHRGDGLYGYLAWYGAIRFWIESQRTDSLMIGNLRTAQLVSILFLFIGILGLTGVFDKIFKKEKPVIVFDFDGTLMDTQDSIFGAFEYVFKKHIPEYKVTEDDKIGFLGPTLEETFRKYIPNADEIMETLLNEYREKCKELHKTCVRTFPGTVDLLKYCKENGYKITIASSKKSDVIRLGLKVGKIEEYFNEIVGIESILEPKPNKETVIKGVQIIGGSKDNAIYVGDSTTDIQSAQNAGVFSIGYCSNMRKEQALKDVKPNRIVYDLTEIKAILEEVHPWTNNMM